MARHVTIGGTIGGILLAGLTLGLAIAIGQSFVPFFRRIVSAIPFVGGRRAA